MLKFRRLLPSKACYSFGSAYERLQPKIGHVWVINLDRQPSRLNEIKNELSRLLDHERVSLWRLTERYSAVDAKEFVPDSLEDRDINPIYTLGEQLFVEPQPLAMPTQIELNLEIQMSRPEIAVAKSHIGIWKEVAESHHDYSLVIEDDVWFDSKFTNIIDRAWSEVNTDESTKGIFDILYLSYEEVKNGAPKSFISDTLFRPLRGLWNLSGYIISRQGAINLLKLLPCNGPIDLWINHQFDRINIIATRKSIIHQRPDMSSTNSYSILPALTKIGAITSERAALFQNWPNVHPVFVFGREGSGLTSVAMALAMLGYRCCNDLQNLPQIEFDKLLNGRTDRIFNAYVNIGCLFSEVKSLKERFPRARIILTTIIDERDFMSEFAGYDYIIIKKDSCNKWQILCEFLRCVPPGCCFPELIDIGQRKTYKKLPAEQMLKSKIPKRDTSPWVIESHPSWDGVYCISPSHGLGENFHDVNIKDDFNLIDTKIWHSREDTFTDNLALFRPQNINLVNARGVSLEVQKELLGVRNFSAASLTSRNQYLYGRFEAAIKVSNTPGIITGFFLHRDSPRQEIDIEISGHRTDTLIVNVFYNPGSQNAKFDYGYRGAPSYINLGFDASLSYHQYAIEWAPTEICWYVDGRLIHRRVDWNPTPIPHLPMSLHANIWPPRSKELAGRLNKKKLPATTFINSIKIKANQYTIENLNEYTLL
ncbi:MAG TPA: family 16 glycosylhydrolase [Candidatus Babeliaceae bacterium]|nr:family 16 glycosylhydrolase [Candidatus Babeliaceae bacterium]